MKADVHLLYYLDEFSLQWEMFHTKLQENQNTHFVSCNFFPKIVPFMW